MNPEDPNREGPFSRIINSSLSEPKVYSFRFGILAAATDKGKGGKRENQDSVIIYFNDHPKQGELTARFAVIDGVGGSENGLFASTYAANAINVIYKKTNFY